MLIYLYMSEKIHHKNQMKHFGGAMWDTLFLLLQSDQSIEFIKEFVRRIPCQQCSKGFLNELKKYDEINYKILWEIRCNIHTKYKHKNNENDLNEYLKYLLL